MKMKHGFLLSAMALFAFIAQAQTSFGFRGGVNFYNINGENTSGDKLKNKIKTGFNAGVTLDVPVAPDFYFQPGLLFSTKGAKLENTSDASVKLNYLELPLNLLYKPTLGTGKLLMGFGPYLGYGLSGKVENGSSMADVKFEKNAGNAANTVYYKPLDAGANLLFGYEFASKLSAQLNAQLGLVNLNAYNNNAKFKNTGFGVSLGYKF